jgi:para-aminobenzoate synthetase component II
MILVVDNYDSFVFNIARYVEELGEDAVVVRNDALTVDGIVTSGAKGLILSPGPCTPNEAGVSVQAVSSLSGRLPILGVCLGHQCIGQAFGATVRRTGTPMHGRASIIMHTGVGLFTGLPDRFRAGRYHSLAVMDVPPGSDIEACAWSEDGEIMAIAHRRDPTFGVQFHPESVLTEHGYVLLAAFLERTRT